MTGLSPYADALGIEPVAGTPSRLRLAPGEVTIGRPGFLHGGVIAALLEAAGYAALRAEIDPEGDGAAPAKPITLTIDFMRAGRLAETFAEARVVRLGGRVANVVAEAWQDVRDRPIASARLTFRIRRD